MIFRRQVVQVEVVRALVAAYFDIVRRNLQVRRIAGCSELCYKPLLAVKQRVDVLLV